MTITGLSQLSSRNPLRLEAVNTCPSNPVFNPLAIELNLYRRLRADETHTLTKFDDYPINTRGVRTMRGQVGPTESSVVDTCHPNFFFNLKAIELKLYRDVRADEPQFLTKFDMNGKKMIRFFAHTVKTRHAWTYAVVKNDITRSHHS